MVSGESGYRRSERRSVSRMRKKSESAWTRRSRVASTSSVRSSRERIAGGSAAGGIARRGRGEEGVAGCVKGGSEEWRRGTAG